MQVDKATLHIGAVAFIHRFGSSLNEHVHFHVCVVDGVFEEVVCGVIFHPASGIDADAVVQVQATLRRRRYCARPPFAMDRLRKEDSELVYRCAKQYSEPSSDKRGTKGDERHLTPLELIARIAALVPPPGTHWYRYFGVLAPNMPLRAAVTAMALPPMVPQATQGAADANTGLGAPGPPPGNVAQLMPAPPKRPAHYLWAVLIARIYEVPISGKYSITSGWSPKHPTSPWRAGRRFGITVVMRWQVKGRKSGRTGRLAGMWRHNRHRTLMLISVSIGE